MWNLDHKESFALKNWRLSTVVLDKTFESPLNSKDIQSINPKGNHPWIFIGRTDTKAETPVLWPTHWKRPWCLERLKAEGEGDDRGWDGWMASPTQWACFGLTPGAGDRQGGLACSGSWCCRVGHKWVTKLNWGHWRSSFSFKMRNFTHV